LPSDRISVEELRREMIRSWRLDLDGGRAIVRMPCRYTRGFDGAKIGNLKFTLVGENDSLSVAQAFGA
jgi:hypothetical protein